MKHHPDDIRVSSNIQELYQRAPQLVFGRKTRPNPHDLCSGLLKQIRLLGAREVHFKRVEDWYIFAADMDWMGTSLPDHVDLMGQFDVIFPFPEAGVNCVRQEPAIKAFALAVVAADQVQQVVVSGEVPPQSPVWRHISTSHARTLAFEFPLAGHLSVLVEG